MPQPTRRVIVDGHNLTMRALSVPALAKLRDRRGRPTGVLHGVLRSAVSVRKAYPSARVTFVWDGSRRRRASVYEGYKRSRPTSGSGQDVDVLWLKDTLPLLDVEQAWSDVEEADDVVATLVRRDDDDETVIFSTDRDFLQLVTARVHVLSPPPKSVLGRGKLYDVARVRQEYGVAPWAMVLLRAVVGDVSDDLHGVPGVGLKIASRLWNMVDRVVLEREHQGGCVECDLAAVDQSLDENPTWSGGPDQAPGEADPRRRGRRQAQRAPHDARPRRGRRRRPTEAGPRGARAPPLRCRPRSRGEGDEAAERHGCPPDELPRRVAHGVSSRRRRRPSCPASTRRRPSGCRSRRRPT